jgi:hypothetical protein
MARDLAKAAAEYAKVLFENDHVRVTELTWKNGLKIEKHAHPKYFAYAFSPLRYTSTASNGKVQYRRMKRGEVKWYAAESHAVSSSRGNGRALIIELK